MFSCSEPSMSTENQNDPSNLQLETIIYDDGSGIVVVNATADNAIEYKMLMGDGTPELTLSSGNYEHTYNTSGSYLIEVKAYGNSGRFISKEKRVIVPSDDPTVTGVGYTTPFEYEGYELLWNDEFNDTQINPDNWDFEIGDGCPNLCGWGNNELEFYKKENCWVEAGVLVIEAREENEGTRNYTSGRMLTRGKQVFQYGRIDIRAKLPQGKGIWPALWLLGTNINVVSWPACGEIDIMEMVGGNGKENTVSANAFWENKDRDAQGLYTLDEGFFYDEFHVFTLIWDESDLKFYVDDELYNTLDIDRGEMAAFHKNFYMLFNVAVGGIWPGNPDATTVFPQQMRVDYVRAFSKK